MLCFTAPPLIDKLMKSSIWFVDGHFKIKLANIRQLFVIGTVSYGNFIPGFVFFLERSLQRDYEEAMKIAYDTVKDWHPEFNFSSVEIMSDMERGIRNAVRKVFKVEPSVCIFHYKQALFRQLKVKTDNKTYREASKNLHLLDNVFYYESILALCGESSLDISKEELVEAIFMTI